MSFMRSQGVVVALLAGCALVGPPVVEAAETEVSAEVSVFSAYVWRGQVYNDEAVLQPALTVERGGFGIGLWGDFNLTDRNDIRGRFSELDLTLWYGIEPVEPLGLEFGLAIYTFPHSADLGDGTYLGGGSTELYAAATLDLPLTPCLTVYRDIDATDGWYAQLQLEHAYELSPKATLAVAFAGGWGDDSSNLYYFDLDRSAANDGNLTLRLELPLRERVVLVPSLSHTWLWDSDVERNASRLYGEDHHLWGGLTVRIEL